MQTTITNDFWEDAEIISVYTDEDARGDGYLIDVSALSVEFNNKAINRLTCGAAAALKFESLSEGEQKQTLEQIVRFSRFDGKGADAWGICKNANIAGNVKFHTRRIRYLYRLAQDAPQRPQK